jgi:V8-like Glu-specific endopeptidase
VKKFVLLLVVLGLSLPAFAISPAIIKAHKASYQIGQMTVSDGARCSATAIGPHALLTATHCELPSDDLYIRGEENPVAIVARIRDGQDHSILLLKGVTFADYVEVDQKSLQVTDDVFTIGNPGDWTDIYQKGYVAGLKVDRSMAAAMGEGEPDKILIDIQAFPGESGAGIFNTSGVLVAVLSGDQMQTREGVSMDLGFAYFLNFKPEDIARAKAFSAEVKK